MGCAVCWWYEVCSVLGCWVYGVMVWVLHALRVHGAGYRGWLVMGAWCWVWGPTSVGCTGCMGVQGAVAREGPQQHIVALPPLGGHWGHSYSEGSPGLCRWMGHVRPITLLDTLADGDSRRWSHTMADTSLSQTPQLGLAAQPQHPNSHGAPR